MKQKQKRITSIICLLLVALMLISLVASAIPTRAYAVTESQIQAIQKEKEALSGRVNECRNRIDLLKQEKATVLEAKSALDEQNRCANEQLNLVAEEIAIYDDLIEEKGKELKKAQDREQEQLERYRTRIRAMEENGSYNILALFLNSRSFGEFLTAMDDMGEIMESDKKLEKQYIEAREETEAVLAEYEKTRDEYEGKQAELKKEQAELEKSIEEAYTELAELEEAINKAIEEYKAAEAAEAAAAASIAGLIAQYNEEIRQRMEQAQQQQQQQQQQGSADGGSGDSAGGNGDAGTGSGGDSGSTETAPAPSGGTGSLMWPVPSSTLVTSRFGNRSDPFDGGQRWHSGIDIDGFNKEGWDIVAADGGTVITAGSNSGYGNYVIIDHGNYTQTLYAHMSYIGVGQGSYVSQGQTIGGLGSTGRSTGTHLHYEVFVNGERVDPESYYSGLSYWNC